MIHLNAHFRDLWDEDPFVVRITSAAATPEDALLLDAFNADEQGSPRLCLQKTPDSGQVRSGMRTILLPARLDHLSPGDVIRVNPRAGEIWVMYRRNANTNSMLLTEQCNSNCIMCSQPPKRGDDRFLARAYLEAIPLMSPETPEIGVTGGEPTLLGDLLFEILRKCKDHLPQTAVHLLSNGRMFNYVSLCQEFERLEHPDLMIGIPLYSDIAHKHDFVVQAQGAFDQTLRGIMNLQRCGQRVEVRVVLHRETIKRLPQLARFIARNLPFVEHVALMGLENMGYVRMNLEALWIDPSDYQPELMEAVQILDQAGMVVSIYNHQLCLLNQELWPFARQSISDWKNEYMECCQHCAAQALCGGFFASSRIKMSDRIRPLSVEDIPDHLRTVSDPTT
ncbi:His-Xaa-Ser system radical SAM maturase HxsC [Planctomicrobium sp. SH661]|uniref:His-Xaa-Ser system radical SAM maturase HxsC n=1 Tax=Planctomicrobium sp. SH661 TaxID=3448124 RepID=UPI003F5C8E10